METIRDLLRGPCLAGLVFLAAAGTSGAGTITFSSNDSALVTALGGSSVPTGVTTVATGQQVTIPFAATVAGSESVSGSIVLSNGGGGGTVQLANLAFTSLLTGTTTTNTTTFGVTILQDFANAGATALNATETQTGGAHFTGPNQIASYAITGSVRGAPGNPFVSTTNNPSQGLFSSPGDPFPEDRPFAAGSSTLSGVPAGLAGPVTLIFAFATNLSTLTGSSGTNSGTNFSRASFGYANAVPEPASLAMLATGLAGVAALARRRKGSAA